MYLYWRKEFRRWVGLFKPVTPDHPLYAPDYVVLIYFDFVKEERKRKEKNISKKLYLCKKILI